MATNRKSYPSDVSDEEWDFCVPYLTLMKEQAPQRKHALRDIFNALRWFMRAGLPVADVAQRPAALGGGAAANPALVAGRLL